MNIMDKSIKVPKLNDLMVGLLFLLCIFSYEKNIHKGYYDLILIIIFGIGVFLFITNIMKPKLNNLYCNQLIENKLIHIISLLLLISSFYSSISLSLLNFRSFLNTILLILSLYVFYLFIPLLIKEKLNRTLDLVLIFISIVSLIGIFIFIRGSILGYYPIYGRAASFMFDPNYYGSFAAIGVVLSMKKNRKYLFLGFINIIGLYFSGSRGAMLSLALSIVIGYFFHKGNKFKKFIVYLLIIALLFGMVFLLNKLGFFRSYQGTSGRDNLWQTSFELIRSQPLWGYGNFSSAFQGLGIGYSSSHNGLIDLALRYGLIPLLIYIIIIIKSFFKGVRNNVPIRIVLTIILLSVNMNTIVISLGGIGGLSLIYTIFLGSAAIYNKEE